MRNRWTLMPVSPTTSALARRSKFSDSTFSSIRVIVKSDGVKAARSGRQVAGMLAFFPKIGVAYSMPQKEGSNRGLISTISAITRHSSLILQLFKGDLTLAEPVRGGFDAGSANGREYRHTREYTTRFCGVTYRI